MEIIYLSLGPNCHAAQNLKDLNLRKFSLPFDWMLIDESKGIFYVNHLINNNFTFPFQLMEEEYKNLKTSEPSALRGFVGYFLSFGGKWFGGYAPKYQRGDRKRDF